ncbi:hypothetical protein [Diplocloster agilis]|nr:MULTISPECIES: hypothetical protein [Lachnospiraceae]MCU6736764.1 hypothetical protein [Suonthocola fibrivorans]
MKKVTYRMDDFFEFLSFEGTVISVANADEQCCTQRITVRNDDNSVVNFIATPNTYFVDHIQVNPGMRVTGWYSANAPAPLIYPPQYTAIAMAESLSWRSVKIDRFDDNLISYDGTLRLILSPYTIIETQNGQLYYCKLAGHVLAVQYTATTRSIPAQTVPERITVLCVDEPQ